MPSELFREGLLEGRVAIVTGGGSGLGRAAALELARLGCKVAICGRKREGLDAAAAQLGGGDDLLAVTAHVAEEEQVEALFQAVIGRFGRLDVLVNNVGMN
ncbi:MAG: SDR family NAD(P)-dependent oxidoreductase, partial [Thermoleophilum sp.]|nr:SDR family NAD(P)-dependent oxidoreductase [Thermoleophilum sp.]